MQNVGKRSRKKFLMGYDDGVQNYITIKTSN
jgi:hypothetical protein